jgi:hypothetical protein
MVSKWIDANRLWILGYLDTYIDASRGFASDFVSAKRKYI